MIQAGEDARVALLQRALKEIGELCTRLGAFAAGDGQPAVPEQPQPIAPPPPPAANGGLVPAAPFVSIPLRDFLRDVPRLSQAERMQAVEAAIAMLEGVFVHLPLKRHMHGIDPVQRLKLVQFRLADEIRLGSPMESDRGFHDEMIEIFHSLRDLHTNYILPLAYQRRTAFLPFLIEEYFDDQQARQFIVTKAFDFDPIVHQSPTFEVGVLVTHWSGIPIERAVEINAAREAGSNPDARHARGLEALTIRPMALSAPPDEDWVEIDYLDLNQQPQHIRFEWKVMAPPQSATGAEVDDPTAGAALEARVMGYDAATEASRRARKAIFDQEAMAQESHMNQVLAAHVQGGAAPPAAADMPLGGLFQEQFNSGLDPKGELVRRGKLQLFVKAQKKTAEQWAKEATGWANAAAMAAMGAADTAAAPAPPSTTSLFPDNFAFRTVESGGEKFGYIRIFSFMVNDADAFAAEFARICQLLPQTGLIIDVRGNGGGNINAGEKVLQVLCPEPIEPARFHFINTPATLKLCEFQPYQSFLGQWVTSIRNAVPTAEVYSQGFPLTEFKAEGEVAYRYEGKKVLIIDSLCYSTTDIFAAGFQDHGLGKVLGTSGRTGAGGANVWPYDYFLNDPLNFRPLPQNMSYRTAIRRSTRVKMMAGVPLEDLGVTPDKVHRMTKNDVLGTNEDLIAEAIRHL